MRASEFTIEGPTDWMNKQIIGRKQKNQAKMRKQNVPKITKAVQEILASKVSTLLKNNSKGQSATSDALGELITQVLSKTLKVNVDSDPYNNALDLIKTQAESNPANIVGNAQISAGIAEIVNTLHTNSDSDDQDASAFGAQHAEVYDLPVSADDRDMIYTNNNNEWSLWQKTGRNRVEFLNQIEPDELEAVKALIRSTKTRPSLMSFAQIQGNHYQTSAAAAK